MENQEESNLVRTEGLQEPVQMERQGVTFKDILHVIRKHWIVMVSLIAVGTAAGLVAGVAQNKLNPKYTASRTMMIAVDSSMISETSAYDLSSKITKTYVGFVTNDAVLDEAASVLKQTHPEYEATTQSLRSGTSASIVNDDSLIMTVSYTCADKQEAIDIDAVIIDAIKTIANSTTLSETGEIVAKYRFLYNNIEPLPSEHPENSVSTASYITKDTLIGFAIGIGAAIVYAVVREMFDYTFKNSEDVERELGLPILAVIPEWQFQVEGNKEGK